jgi:hypothetical protein
VLETHVTLAHHSSTSQSEMKSKFGSYTNATVCVEVTGLLWSGRVAALSVASAMVVVSKDIRQPELPASANSFPHITVWVADEARAHESNQLPVLVDQGAAQAVVFPQSIFLEGVMTFWY